MGQGTQKFRWDPAVYLAAFCAVALLAMYLLKEVARPAVLLLAVMIVLALFYVGCRLLRSFFTNKPGPMNASFLVLLVMVPTFGFLGFPIVGYALTTRRPPVAEFLADGRLPPLPTNASEIETFEWMGMFTGVEYLTFKAPADDINQWLEAWEEFSNQTATRLPFEVPEINKWKSSKSPAWFQPSTETTGRWFLIPHVDEHNRGDVIVDDEANVVYVRVIWS
ncbi:hypothetical protein OAH18_02920 [bacterium]|nr:hypothetical protein [bacterium]